MTDYERIKREYDLSLLEKNRLISKIYPVGSIYMSVQDVSPASIFGGVWRKIENAFLFAASKAHPAGEVGGEESVALTTDQMPEHYHDGVTTDSLIDNYRMTYENGDSRNTGASAYWAIKQGTEPGGNTARTTVAGNGEAHNNMPPYLSVYIWVRIK